MPKKPSKPSQSSAVPGYSHEVCEQAVRLMSELRYTPSQIADKFGCTAETARSWKKQYVQTFTPGQAADKNDTKTN